MEGEDRMKKGSGKGRITKRDDDIMLTLYNVHLLTDWQIARMYFPTRKSKANGTFEPSIGAARQRLGELKWMGMLETWVCKEESVCLWKLAKDGFDRQANAVDNLGEKRRPWPIHRNVRHYIDTNELYVLLAGDLDAILGGYPAWVWRSEARASHRYNVGGREGRHKPDAEVEFHGRVYFLERQTERSREPRSYFENRMEDYKHYEGYARSVRGLSRCEVLWACDTERDMNHAFEAGKRKNLNTLAESPQEACDYIIEQAEKVVAEPRSQQTG